MYIKRLEIQGFKSFAERVVIEFDKGITVIVGPNGCGKSNLTDAVQWVLGEQSARSLRGYRMDDVIFSGTSRRRPLGMAEVSVTFDNSEQTLSLPYREVNITRRVYRSGEGEYLINKKVCRLRDIQELFAQCGISRAAFSITSQGKIDEFIMVHPQERRVFLEDVAGVSNYRQRKNDALRKLKETEDSLARLQDLLAELEKRRLPLKEQAEVAEQYQKLLQLFRDVEKRLLEGQLAEISNKEDVLFGESEQIKTSLGNLESSFHPLERELTDFKHGLSARRKGIEQQEGKLYEIQKVLQEVNADCARLEEKVTSCDIRKGELKARLAVIVERKAETRKELAELLAECEQLKLMRLQVQQKLDVLEDEKRSWDEQKKETNRTWEEIDQEIFDILHQKTSLVSEVRVLNNKKELLTRQQQSLSKKRTEAKAHIEELKEKISELDQLCREREALLAADNAELEKNEKHLEALTQEQEELSAGLNSLSQEINREQEHYRILKDAENHQEGYQQGVRTILHAVSKGVRFSGEKPLLVEELLQIDPTYGVALDTALGRAAHHFICSTPQTAQDAIAYLKSEKGGRASFFPLSALGYWSTKKKDVIQVNGFIGRMSELVTCDQQHIKLAEYLLGRTYLVDNLENASVFAEKNKYQYRVVTLNGDLIQAGGLFTGGASKARYSTTRGRKQKLSDLEAKIQQNRKGYAFLGERKQQLQIQLEGVKKRVQELRENCRQKEDARRDNEHRLTTWMQELKKLEELYEGYRLESEELQYNQQELNQQICELEKDLELIKTKEGDAGQKRMELERMRHGSEEKTQDIMSRLSAAQVSYSTVSQDLKHQEQKKEQVKHLLELREREYKNVEQELAVLEGEKSGILQQEKNLREQLAVLTAQKNQIDDTISFRKKQVAAWERYINAKERRYLRLKEILMKSKQRLQNNSIKLQHLKEQRDEIISKAAEENMQLEQDPKNTLKRKEEFALKENAALLKKKMAALGEVNFAAPGEYQELKERISLFKEQIEDLEQGKNSLTRMIADFDRVASSRFKKTFQEVRSNFREIFHLLSDGGDADLILTDKNDLLETGIDICVIPRGKKPRHLSLLSGGEKSLTGISFLFALLQSNPSPFYLLDEIEAFLDEANLVRFANFLRQWSVGYQLILISHRYHTMEIADTLFGVTMNEPGVSKLVSVRLSEFTPEDKEQYIS